MLPTAGAGSRPPLAQAKVLGVDDTPTNLVALEAILAPLGVDFVRAESGSSALALTQDHDFAVILLDIQMPGLNGFETLAQLREGRATDTPVILITATEQSRVETERAYLLGAFDFMVKPIDSVSLRGKVSAFVSFHDRGRELLRQQEALKAKDRYLGVLAHDLRTPLSVMRFAAYSLASDERAANRAIAARIERSTSRMEKLVRDLLDCARAAAHRMPVKKAAMDLVGLCQELVADFSATYPDVRFSSALPEAIEGLWDRHRLYQAIANLLNNALKYGDGHVQLELTAEQDDVVLCVANRGAPIASERLELIFEAFVQGSEGEGVGLGLFIVREIARAHGGDVSVSSEADRTCFTIRLPLGFSPPRRLS